MKPPKKSQLLSFGSFFFNLFCGTLCEDRYVHIQNFWQLVPAACCADLTLPKEVKEDAISGKRRRQKKEIDQDRMMIAKEKQPCSL